MIVEVGVYCCNSWPWLNPVPFLLACKLWLNSACTFSLWANVMERHKVNVRPNWEMKAWDWVLRVSAENNVANALPKTLVTRAGPLPNIDRGICSLGARVQAVQFSFLCWLGVQQWQMWEIPKSTMYSPGWASVNQKIFVIWNFHWKKFHVEHFVESIFYKNVLTRENFTT